MGSELLYTGGRTDRQSVRHEAYRLSQFFARAYKMTPSPLRQYTAVFVGGGDGIVHFLSTPGVSNLRQACQMWHADLFSMAR